MALPFTIPSLSRGFSALTPAARAAGAAALAAVAAALSRVLGLDVLIAARPLPAEPVRAAGVARVALSLEGVPATAALEIDAGLLARALERLGGTSPRTPAALRSSDVEQHLLELLTLVAIDAARSPNLDVLVPRLAHVVGHALPEVGALVIGLDFRLGDERGWGRLLVPPAALAMLAGAFEPTAAALEVALPASLRRGTTTLTQEDLAALAPRDVLLLDGGTPLTELVLPGGLTLRGHAEDDHFIVEGTRMTETQAAYPITLSIEIARVTVRLGELAQLEQGTALRLGVPAEGTVVLRAGECAIARGQLVDIDGALGVRIEQIGDRP